jgi:hypothetical protein
MKSHSAHARRPDFVSVAQSYFPASSISSATTCGCETIENDEIRAGIILSRLQLHRG